LVHITAIFGFTLSGLVVQDVMEKNGLNHYA
jgi:tRNA A37 threonylcarbamoyladenosine dehydratase